MPYRHPLRKQEPQKGSKKAVGLCALTERIKKMEFTKEEKKALLDKMVAFRRERHKHPENGWTEFYATAAVIKELQALGIPYKFGRDVHTKEERMGVPDAGTLRACMDRAIAEGADPELVEAMEGGYTGCVAILDTGRPGPVSALRVDMDCNDVGETEDPEHYARKEGFASVHPNLMHACGHDAHTAIGVGVATALAGRLDGLCGRILIIFQPAEEGVRGGESMAKSGILDGVNYLFGGHVGAGKELGVCTGGSKEHAFTYKLDLKFTGEAAHAGGSPEKGNNAALAAATALIGCYSISRHSKGYSRVNIGAGRFGPGRNVICDEAVLIGEVRGQTEEINEYMYNRVLEVCRGAAAMYNCSFECQLKGHAIDAECDREMVELAIECAKGIEGITSMTDFSKEAGGGGAEDVCFMMKEVQRQGGKATYMSLGAGGRGPHHNTHFHIEEDIMLPAAELYCNMFEKLNSADKTE